MKNWLIRTSSNQIFGPISKDKVVDLINNKTITFEDEICSGNGYWFFLREHELVQRYVFSDTSQSFNPISEAKDVLGVGQVSQTVAEVQRPEIEREHTTHLNLNDLELESDDFGEIQLTDDESDDLTQIRLPSDDDLDYPDPEATKERIDLSEMGDLKSEGRRASDNPPQELNTAPTLNEDEGSIRYPDNDDLEYPELD